MDFCIRSYCNILSCKIPFIILVKAAHRMEKESSLEGRREEELHGPMGKSETIVPARTPAAPLRYRHHFRLAAAAIYKTLSEKRHHKTKIRTYVLFYDMPNRADCQPEMKE
jgi:hypothetical protein